MNKITILIAAALAACGTPVVGRCAGNDEQPPEPPEWTDGERPPAPPGWDGKGRPPAPPDGFGGGRHGNGSGRQSRMQGRGPGGSYPGGGMREDPSDASIYSGVETIESGSKEFAKVALVSGTKNTAPVYVKAGAKVAIKGGTIDSSASGANAVLAIGKGAKAMVEDVVISTTEDSSRGLYAFQQGEIRARNVKISTKGAHCAAMATDRGEGVVSVESCVLDTAGDGSPCIYSTGELSAKDSSGTATGSEAMVIEGRNSITLEGTRLTGCKKCGAMLYQSFSGDAMTGTARLDMKKSSLVAKTGPLFYVTNTRAEIVLEDCSLKCADGESLLRVAAGRWGRSGANGGNVTLSAQNQTLQGDVEVDAVSEATLVIGAGSVWKGAFDTAGTAKASSVTVEGTWSLTADSHVGSLKVSPTGKIEKNGFKLSVER